ncbi:hypothetical protein E2562_017821 [Oryza meyeriana var. granulata]|uniref:DUF834 domain-containing protein n=1 Tax=Oryza meyeriana var. granulata TaxID=110450 RepID=A0A6G1E082_9ORYZ|nr:hypothetical protein E2562_017821 [Oryza meyeriana var. granulata]
MQARRRWLRTVAFDDQTTVVHGKWRGQGLGTTGGGAEEETMIAGLTVRRHGKPVTTETHRGNKDDEGDVREETAAWAGSMVRTGGAGRSGGEDGDDDPRRRGGPSRR